VVKKVTIQDISQFAGTSASTVSRVLNGSAIVSDEKRKAVEQAIESLNYRPSHIARSLKTRITFTIGLLLNDISNPFYSAVVRGAEEEAIRHGYSLILCNTNESEQRERQFLELLQDKRVDGIIFSPTGQNQDYICDLALRVPLIQIDRHLDCGGMSYVLADNEGGTYQATRLLIEKGHKRIALFRWKRNITTMLQRLAGYERAMAEAGLSLDPSLIIECDGMTLQDAAEKCLQEFQPSPRFTAALALNNQIGLGILTVIRQLELRIPEDLALIVFDHLDLFDLTDPTISTIAQPAFLIGEQAMRLLLKQIEAGEQFTPEWVVLPIELMMRESV